MAKARKPTAPRKPPVPSDGHADIEDWIPRVMPDLHPIVKWLDEFDPPPPLGTTERTRYIKVKTLEEAREPEMHKWIEQAGRVPGWQ